MTSIPKALEDAYKATRYEVSLGGRIAVIRIGEQCSAIDDFCDEHSVTSWAFMTACNPLSNALSDADNRDRQQLLAALLSAGEYDYVVGEGIGEAGEWPPEPSFLVPGMDREKAFAYGRVFDQYAVVYGDRGGVAQLLCCV